MAKCFIILVNMSSHRCCLNRISSISAALISRIWRGESSMGLGVLLGAVVGDGSCSASALSDIMDSTASDLFERLGFSPLTGETDLVEVVPLSRLMSALFRHFAYAWSVPRIIFRYNFFSLY